jgi:RNA polymerase sigma-70 factor (ECF subfamily)
VENRVTPELLGLLLDEHGPALALYAAQWTDEADDCVQEGLIELARQRQVPASPIAWLYRVVRNRAISRFRTTRRRERREELAVRLRGQQGRAGEGSVKEGEAPAEPIDNVELAAAFALLADELREAVVARIWGGLNFEQIAELAGCSTSTAHRRYEAGLAALRERIQPQCPTNLTTALPMRAR